MVLASTPVVLNGFDVYACGRYENGTAYPGYMKQVPTSIDYISCDIYETRAQSVDPKRGGASRRRRSHSHAALCIFYTGSLGKYTGRRTGEWPYMYASAHGQE